MRIRTLDEKAQPTVADIPEGSHVAVVTSSALYSDLDGAVHICSDEWFDVNADCYSQHIVRHGTHPIPGGPFTGEVREVIYLVVSSEPFTVEGSVMATNSDYGTDNADRVEWHNASKPLTTECLAEHHIEVLEQDLEEPPYDPPTNVVERLDYEFGRKVREPDSHRLYPEDAQ